MAHLKRYLTIRRLRHGLGCGLAMLAATGPLPGQAAAPRTPATFRTLALGAAVAGLHYDHRGQPVPLTAGSSGFSAPQPVPDGGRLTLYRALPPESPGRSPRRTIVADVPLGDSRSYLLFLWAAAGADPQIHAKAVDDTWDAHPVQTMRIFNFSHRRSTVKLDEAIAELPSGHSHLFNLSTRDHAWLQAAFWESDTWVLRIGSPQVTLPRGRSIVVLLDQEPSPDMPATNEIVLRNLIDPEPAPPNS